MINHIPLSSLYSESGLFIGIDDKDIQEEYVPRVSEYFENFAGVSLSASWPKVTEGYQAELYNDILVLSIAKNSRNNTYKLGPLWIENFDLKPYITIQYRNEVSLNVAIQLKGPGGSVSEQELFLLPASDEWKTVTLNLSGLATEDFGFHLDSIIWDFEPGKTDYSGTLYINEILIGDTPSGKRFEIDIEEPEIPVVDLGPTDTLIDALFMELDAGNEGAAYLWNTGETTRTIIAGTSGVYSVMVIGDYNCSAESSIDLTFRSSGLEEIINQAFSMSIFPNPAQYQLFLKSNFLKKEKNITIEIINQAGEIVRKRYFKELSPEVTYEINLGLLPPGLYLLRTSFKNHTYITKSIIVY